MSETRGRPLDGAEKKVPLTTWVPKSYTERLGRIATAREMTVSKLVCRVLEDALRRKPTPEK